MSFTVCAGLLQVVLAVAGFVGMPVVGASPAHAAPPVVKQAAVSKSDPLQGDVWHAMGGTWPGTIVFDGKTKKVVLSPVGGEAIQADYAVTGVQKKGGETGGDLRMTNAAGQVVSASFTMKDHKNLIMRFASGQRDEVYVRMTPAEEEAEKARLVKMLEEKRKATIK